MYALGHLSEQMDGSGNPLATFTYEASGRPASVVLGNPSTGSRYYYVYNGHGDVVALTDSSGNVVASYQYDAFGVLTSSSENFPNGWSNPYRYDGADLVRYDSETGLYWMSVRAYDPTLGRFISHNPLGGDWHSRELIFIRLILVRMCIQRILWWIGLIHQDHGQSTAYERVLARQVIIFNNGSSTIF